MRPIDVAPGLLLLALAAAPAARADDRLEPPAISRSRGLLSISVEGRVASSGPLVARVRRDGATALDLTVTPDDKGAFRAALLTPRLLLPDHYVLEVGPPGGAAVVSRPFQVGDDDEVVAARARLEAWYRAAHGALRDLAVGLERRGLFHRALAAQDHALHVARFDAAFEGWSAALRAARMDLATWERRLVLPWRPEAGPALLEVVRALEARGAAWRQALTTRGAAPPADALERAAAALVQALGLPSAALEGWRPGPLAAPPAGAPAGTAALEGLSFTGGFASLRDATGFALLVPEGFKALAADQRPTERLVLEQGPTRILVQAQELPDLEGAEAFAVAVETGAFEQYLSYKRLSAERLPGPGGAPAGLRLEFLAQVERTEELVRVTQVSRWAGPRVFHLLLVRPRDAAAPAWLERVAGSFAAEAP